MKDPGGQRLSENSGAHAILLISGSFKAFFLKKINFKLHTKLNCASGSESEKVFAKLFMTSIILKDTF
jgi:hypothetical protein